MAGIRADYTRYFNHANFNQTVYDELGLRTDNVISTFQLQPRIQFTWDVNDKHQDIIRLAPVSSVRIKQLFDDQQYAVRRYEGSVRGYTRQFGSDTEFPGIPKRSFYRSGRDLFNTRISKRSARSI